MRAVNGNVVAGMLLLLALLVAGGWTLLSFVPRAQEIGQREFRLRSETMENRRARQEINRTGIEGADAELARLRREEAWLRERIPDLSEEGVDPAALQLRERIATFARRFRVETPQIDPLAAVERGSVRVDGYRVTAWGDYHQVGAFIAELEGSAGRLVQIEDVSLVSVPDSLLASHPSPGVPEPMPPGAPQEAAVMTFSLRWFSRPAVREPTGGGAGTL